MQKQGFEAGVCSELNGDPHWQLVQRIIASPQFIRSARLKDFLFYVTRCALLDRADEVTEQQIGIHVFGRPADYRAGEDNIVRSQARFLRAKLAEYFDSPPGRDEPVVLSIPKGSYLPHFTQASEVRHVATIDEHPAAVDVHTEPQPVIVHPAAGWRRWRILGFALLGLAVLALWLGRGRLGVPGTSAGFEASVWPQLFNGRQTTTIVASDYIFSMVQEAAGRSLTLDEYLGADYFDRVAKLNASSGLDRLFPNIAQRHYTGFENVTSVGRLMALKQAQGTRTVVRFARDVNMRDIGSGNLILLGSKQSNPWELLFENKLNFRFEYQNTSHSVFIVNQSPEKGEAPEYHPSALDATTRVVYGAIAFLPNLHRGSNVLILQGTSMGGTEAALEVLGDPALFQELIRRLTGRVLREGTPPYFEALIRVETINGVVGESSITACRRIP